MTDSRDGYAYHSELVQLAEEVENLRSGSLRTTNLLSRVIDLLDTLILKLEKRGIL